MVCSKPFLVLWPCCLVYKWRRRAISLNSEAGLLINVIVRFDIIQALMVIITAPDLLPPFNTMSKNE